MPLAELPILSLLVGFVIMSLGSACHYAKKWVRGEISINIFTYLLVNNRKATLAVVMANVASTFALITSGGADPLLVAGAISLFTVGYTIDSSLNKS